MSKIIKADAAITGKCKPYEAMTAVSLTDFAEDENPYDFNMDEDAVATAEQRAIDIVDKALKKAKEIERQAFERGYQAGEGAVRENYQRQAFELSSRTAETLDLLAALEEQLYTDAETNMVDLSLKIARRVINREVSTQPEVVRELVRAAYQRVSGSPYIRVRVSMDDFENIQASKDHLFGNPEKARTIVVEVDGSIEPGGCVVDAGSATVDARIGKSFSEICKVILGV